MNSNLFINLILIVLLNLPISLFSSDNLSYGIKAGIGFETFISVNSAFPVSEDFPEYSYPPGYSFGIFIENKLLKDISIVNELIFHHERKKTTVSTWTDGILEQEIISKNIIFSSLFKYQTKWLWNTYFLGGAGLGYLFDAENDYYDKIYKNKGNDNITEKLPKFTTLVEIGIGEKLNINKSSSIILEIKAQIGLTRFDYLKIGKWNNAGLTLFIGYQIF